MNDNLDITLEALNLTDEFQDQYVDSNGDRLSYYHHQGRQYLLGARYRVLTSARETSRSFWKQSPAADL